MNRPEIIAQRLRTARQFEKLTQVQLSSQIPCDPQIISNIERQKYRMSIDNAIAISKILGVRVTWLLDLEEEDEMSKVWNGSDCGNSEQTLS